MKKVVLLSLVLVLCLAAVGIGYAEWSDTLNIDGVVSTGEVAVGITVVGYGDGEMALPEPKDVGEISYAYVYGDTLLLGITNAYPCYTGTVNFRVDNLGSIPVHVEAIVLLGVSKAGVSYPLGTPMPLETCTVYYVKFVEVDDGTGTGNTVTVPVVEPASAGIDPDDYEFDIHVTTIDEGQQIDPAGMAGPNFVPGDLHVHVDQAADMNAMYDFVISIAACQWNEGP